METVMVKVRVSTVLCTYVRTYVHCARHCDWHMRSHCDWHGYETSESAGEHFEHGCVCQRWQAAILAALDLFSWVTFVIW